MEDILKLDKTIHLGMIDDDCYDAFQQNRTEYFKKYHQRFWNNKLNKEERRTWFRGESLDEWVEPCKIPGNNIKALQRFLNEHGFMPSARIDGIFGYWTLSSVRLFQEYIRTVESKMEIGIPDGRVGNGTHEHMKRWKEQGLYSIWGPLKRENIQENLSGRSPSREYELWLDLIKKVKKSYEAELEDLDINQDGLELYQLHEVNNYPKNTDTIKIKDWSYDSNHIHLIGLRCFQDSKGKQGNDDLFVLLMNGLVFKFWGSTDPKPKYTSDGYEPYLLEGQHKYRLSWHKVGSKNPAEGNKDIKKVYKALVPYQNGVLVFRDWSKTDALNENDIRKGLQYNPTDNAGRNNPNSTINIHWTFDGKTNWSAGCQVISGRSYINNQGNLIDCSNFSAVSYGTVSPVSKPGVKNNRGAYTFISDFIFAYANSKQDYVIYTLGRDGILEKFANQELLHLLNEQIPNSKLSGDLISGEALAQEMVSAMSERRIRSGSLS